MFSTNPLTQIDGYIILISFGTIFTFLMVIITINLQRYNGEYIKSIETFLTGNRKVKIGLISSSIVSSWTWSATLLHSTTVTYLYGISGSYWYAGGATIQIILFSIIGIELKRRAPYTHTYLEIINARYGFYGHIIYIIYFLSTNILITLMLLTGGSIVINSLCKIHIIIACFILPLGTIIYTIIGGIKATFLTHYIHTIIILIIILFFTIITYKTSFLLGSPSKVYDLLINTSFIYPIKGNINGSYLTMKSQNGILFFFINIIGNFPTVFLDNSYYNKIIASSIKSTLFSYILGGIAWFPIPFLISTTMGLSTIVLENNPLFPTYPNRLNENDIKSGLILPAIAVTLLGKLGAIICLILVFISCTSSMSGQFISISSIITYDIYKTYINKNANNKNLIFISSISILLFGLIMSCFSILLYYININLGYLYSLIGIIISSGVIPCILTLLWNKQNKLSFCLSPILGTICGIISWLLITKYYFGIINIETTSTNISMFIGNLVGLLSPLIFILIFNLIKPDLIPYDFISMKEIKLINNNNNLHQLNNEEIERGIIYLKKYSKLIRIISILLTIIIIIIFPLSMYGSSYIFSKTFFIGWILFGIMSLFISFFIVGIYPIIENYQTIKSVIRLIYFDIKTFRERVVEDIYPYLHNHS